MTDAGTHSYVFRCLSGSWMQLTFVYEKGSPWPAYFGTYNHSWADAMHDARVMQTNFCRHERKRQARVQAMIDFEKNYREDAA